MALDGLAVVVRKGVIDRVLHQLVEHDRERRRDLAGQLARVTLDLEAEPLLVGADTVSSTTRTSGRTMSSKGTTSPASRDSVSCTIAIERMRRSDSSIASLRLR